MSYCYKPLIKLLDKSLIFKNNGNQFISYKHFEPKAKIKKLVNSNKIRVYPCGNCLNCINMNRYHWVKKMELERSCWKYSYFLTLTYSDEFLPDELKVRDLQNFIKYLRKLIKPFQVRYFGCGEYGTKTKRPHYHVILFTDYEFDLRFLKNTKNGPLFDCMLINKAWKNQGFIWVAHDIQGSSFAYTCSYSNKSYLKQIQNEQKKDFKISMDLLYMDPNLTGFEKYILFDLNYMRDNVLPKSEFIVFSKNPPLGSLKKSINSPSSLLKWFDMQEFKDRHIEKYCYDENNVKYAILRDIELQKTKWLDELNKRKDDYLDFMKHNDLYDIIENERTSVLRKKQKKDVN